MSAVAEAAGVGMGSLYRRFASKAEMVQHLWPPDWAGYARRWAVPAGRN